MRHSHRSAVPSARSAGGFSLIELLVAMAIAIAILVGVLRLFDLSAEVAQNQTSVAEMQQSSRIAQRTILRRLRMAGRGPLPVGTLPAGTAIEVCNNAQVDPACDRTEIAIDFEDSPTIAAGTDVLAVRGVFSAPLWQVNHTDPTNFTINISATEVTGTLRIPSVSHTGVPQPNVALIDAVDGDPTIREPLILVSPLDDEIYAVVELDPDTSDVSDPDNLVLGFKFSGGERTADYQILTGSLTFPAELTSVAFAGILEEYRYYVREADPSPRLAVARMFPGTEIPYQGSLQELQMDVARDVVDLQIALGIDLDGGGTVTDSASAADEWLFNHPDDDPDPGPWNVAGRRLSYVRVNTLTRTGRPDRNYRAAPLRAIEDRAYDETPVPADENQRRTRMHRRRVVESVVDLRNL